MYPEARPSDASVRAAQALGVRIVPFPVPGPEALDGFFQEVRKGRPDGVVVPNLGWMGPHIARIAKELKALRVPAIAIVPWFIAGALFPITALPNFLTWVARFLPITHGLALMRYGLLRDPSGLDDIWGLGSNTAMAAMSLGVVMLFALALTAAAVRVFSRAAVR